MLCYILFHDPDMGDLESAYNAFHHQNNSEPLLQALMNGHLKAKVIEHRKQWCKQCDRPVIEEECRGYNDHIQTIENMQQYYKQFFRTAKI